ncbi:ASCH domain-containing protein [Treponema sp.]|uniref:ASCH domain-containing protein n=1 Tax=Treponema sp. TaxID=166 RepID=UPI00388FECEB
MTEIEFWKSYLKATDQSEENAVYSRELVFEDSGFTGTSQLSLVLSGAKTAVFTPLDSIEINRESVPVAGETYIVLDSKDEPCCVIELTDVNILPFNEISWELAKRDGENENLSDWQDKMHEFLEDEADLCGFEAREDSKIVCEIFRVIYKKEA